MKIHVRRALVDHPTPTPQPSSCRLWQGATSYSYGFRPDGQRVHRWVLEVLGEDQFGTPYSDELIVMHLCDQPLCFRFDHLRLATHTENNADMRQKGRGYVPPPKQGDEHPQAKLTEADVVTIRERYACGPVSMASLAAEYGVSKSNIEHIIHRRRWTHVP